MEYSINNADNAAYALCEVHGFN